jgi:hypothetical protein
MFPPGLLPLIAKKLAKFAEGEQAFPVFLDPQNVLFDWKRKFYDILLWLKWQL